MAYDFSSVVGKTATDGKKKTVGTKKDEEEKKDTGKSSGYDYSAIVGKTEASSKEEKKLSAAEQARANKENDLIGAKDAEKLNSLPYKATTPTLENREQLKKEQQAKAQGELLDVFSKPFENAKNDKVIKESVNLDNRDKKKAEVQQKVWESEADDSYSANLLKGLGNRYRSTVGNAIEDTAEAFVDLTEAEITGYKPGDEITLANREAARAYKMGENSAWFMDPIKEAAREVAASNHAGDVFDLATAQILEAQKGTNSQFAKDVISAADSSAQMLAYMSLPGGATNLSAYMAIPTAAEKYNQVRAEGGSKEEAFTKGIISGAFSYLVEKSGGIGGSGNVIEDVAAKNFVTRVVSELAQEGGEELVQYGLEYINEAVFDLYYNGKTDAEFNLGEALHQAWVGGLAGGGFGLVGSVSDAISGNSQFDSTVGEVASNVADIIKAKFNSKTNDADISSKDSSEPSAEPVEGTEKIASTTFIPKKENSSTVEEDLKNLAKETVEKKAKEISEKEPTASATNKAGRYVQTISDKGLEEYGSKLPNATKDTGKQIAAMYDPADGISKEAFAKGIDEAYKYGTFNYPIREMDSDSVFAKAIPSKKRHQAYYMGQQNAKAANIENAKIMQKKVLPGVKGKVVIEDGVDLKKLSEHQKTVIELTDMLSKVNEIEHHVKASYELKKDYFYKNKKGETIKIKAGTRVWEMDGKIVPAENGWLDIEKHQIWYDINAGDQGQGIPEQTVDHEYLHDLKVYEPEKYNELVEVVSEVFERNGKSFSEAVAVKLKNYNDQDIDVDEAGAQEEIIAQAMSGMFNDPKTLEEFSKVLYKKDKTLWNEIKDWIAEIIERIKEAFKGVEIESEEARMLKAEKDLYERAQKIYVEGIVEAGEKYKAYSETFKDLVKSTEGDTDVYKDKNGAVVAVAEKGNENNIKYNIGEYRGSGKKILENWLDEHADKKTKDQILVSMDAAVDIVDALEKQIPVFKEWGEVGITFDDSGKPVLRCKVKNGEYEINFDFSTVCKKRKGLDAVLNNLIKSGKINLLDLSKSDIQFINETLDKHGFEIACGLCFVDSKRYRVGEWAHNAATMFNDLVNSLVKPEDLDKIGSFNFAKNEAMTVIEGDISTWDDSLLDFSTIDNILATESNAEGMGYKKAFARLIKANPKYRKFLTSSDIISSGGSNVMRNEASDLLAAVNAVGGTSKPKMSFSESIWDHSILLDNRITKEAAYAMGGARTQSFSDFVATMFFDYCQMFAEAQAKGLPMQAYTKELTFAKLFGLTGLRLNLSVLHGVDISAEDRAWLDSKYKKNPKTGELELKISGEKDKERLERIKENAGLDAYGNYIYEKQSIDFDESVKLQNTEGYSRYIGTIVVGISEKHIWKLLDDIRARMIIPYHKSGLSAVIAKARNIDCYTDFTKHQNTRLGKSWGEDTGKGINSAKLSSDTKSKLKEIAWDFYSVLHAYEKDWDTETNSWKKGTGHANTITYEMDSNGISTFKNDPMRQTCEDYLAWCKENDMIPQFEQFIKHPNYYKMQEDFDVYDCITGEYVPQGSVEFRLPENAGEVLLEELKLQQETSDRLNKEMSGIVDEIINERGRQIPPEINLGIKHSLREVKPVQSTSDKWKRTSTTSEVMTRFPDLWNVAAEESETRNPTQITGTVRSYRKIYDFLKDEGFDGKILDASSGLGYGTKAGIEEYGFDVEDIEPYPDKNYHPKYKDYSKLNKKYDVIISNAVLNVIPQDQRDALVVKMGELLNEGGRMFINVRGKDVENASSKVAINSDLMEYYISNTGSYQKGFTKPELVAYLQDALGDGYDIKATNMFGAVSAVVTKQTNGDTGVKRQDRLSNADKNRVEILENKNARLEKELADLEKAYESVQNYARAEGILIGQVEQGRTMAKEMRQKQATFDRKAKGYENAIAKKKEQISAVRQQKNNLLAKAKAERAEAVERVRKADRERMEKAIADIKAKEKEKFDTAKAMSDEQKRAIIEKYQTSIKKATEGRHRTDIRGKIKRVVNELNTLLTRQTKEKHIPLELQKPVAAALDILNLDDPRYYNSRIKNLEEKIENAKSSEERHLLEEERNKILDQRQTFEDKIAGLKKAYEAIRTSTDPYIAVGYNENIAKKIDMVAEDIGDTLLRDMSKAQLEEVYDLYKGILKTVRDANKFFVEEKTANVIESGIEAIKELEKNKTIEKVSESGLNRRKFFWNNLKPPYAFRRMGSKILERLFKNIRKGEDTWAKDVEEAKKFHDKTANKYNLKKWNFNKTFEFTSNTGRKFSLNLGQMMSLYAYSKRDQAYKHLTDGGFVFDDSTTFKKNGKEYYFNAATANNITVAELQKIIGKLSTDQRMFVDEMQKYLSETMGAKGNEVSRAMYDIELFKEGESYFPLKSAKQFLVDRNEVTNATKQLVNSGFTKPIQPGANNPIVLSDFRDVWAAHVNDMSMYHAFVMPIEDFNRVYNVQVGRSEDMDSVSVKSAVQNAFTKAANDYIEQLIKDINGGARTDPREGTYKKFIGNWKKASVFASLSVVIQQPSAIGRAFAEINPVYFMIPTKVSDISHKKQWEQLKKYAPVAFIKEMGYFDTDMSRSTTDYIKGDKTFKDKLDDIAGWAPAKADELTWCAIWDAVKRETKAKHKDLNVNSEEFLKIAGERFTDVIINTQVYDSVLSRSANMRSKGVFMQMLTAFMAEPTTTANMVEQAFREAKAGHPKKAIAYVSSVGVSVVLNSVLVSLVYAMRDDDEDERFHEKYLESLNKEIIDGFNPLTYVPLIKDIWSIFQGWKVERVDLALLQDLYDAADKAFKETLDLFEGIQKGDLSEEEIREGLKAIGTDYVLPVVDVIGNMMGVPIKNIRRDVDAFINTYGMVVGKNDLSYSKKYLDDVLHDATLDQLPFGHHFMESKDDRLIDGMRSGDKTYLERLKGTYKTEEAYDNAVKAVIKNNFLDGEISETQVKRYLMEYNGKDEEKAEEYLDSWKFEKKYGFQWSDRAEAYANGQISASNLEKAIMEHKGKTAAEAEAERRSFDFKQAYPDTSLSDDQIKNYYLPITIKNTDKILKSPYEQGISEETYSEYVELKSECKGVDKDGDGKADSGTVKKEVMKVINRLDLTKEQKDALYFDNGWVKSTLHEAPWR